MDTGNWSVSAEAAKKKHEVAKKKLAQHASVRAAKKKDAERAAVSAHRTKVKSDSELGEDDDYYYYFAGACLPKSVRESTTK